MKLSHRLTVIFLLLGIVPMVAICYLSTSNGEASLSRQAYLKLEAVSSIKKAQIEQYFDKRREDIIMLSEILSNLYDEYLHLTRAQLVLSTGYEGSNYFEAFVETYGYDDLLLIDPSGDVTYTVDQGEDYKTNLNDGPYRESGLADVFRMARDERRYAFHDFEPYAASGNAPAAFIAYPIFQYDQLVVVVALRLSINGIDHIMQLREGMGETGESYLVGPDKRMRSDSYLDPEGHSVKASFAGTVEHNGIDSASVREALQGNTGITELIDYNGNPVLSAYAPVRVADRTWALISEIDVAEAMAPVYRLRTIIASAIALTLIVVLVTGVLVARRVTRPLGGEPEEMKRISESISSGDLTLALNDRGDTGTAYAAMTRMTHNLRDMITAMAEISDEMAGSADETSVITRQTGVNIKTQQGEAMKISTAMTELVGAVQSVAANTGQALEATMVAVREVNTASGVVGHTVESVDDLIVQISQASDAIAAVKDYSDQVFSILEVISGIAEQTNLLALNAAIESARAGDHGRGFAVVADEVRSLSVRTQDSTRDIDRIVKQLQVGAEQACEIMSVGLEKVNLTRRNTERIVQAMTVVEHSASTIHEMMTQIASATEQQSAVSTEINGNIEYIGRLSQENAGGAEQIADASQELARTAERLNHLIRQFRT